MYIYSVDDQNMENDADSAEENVDSIKDSDNIKKKSELSKCVKG